MKQRICFPLLLVAIIVAFSQSGCKENVLIDSAISPSDNVLGVYDTSLSIITHTYNDDTALTSYADNGGALRQAVGAMEDPFFGTMNGATFFQLVPTDATTQVYDGKTIDSAVLVLPYSGSKYGDTADQTNMAYQVFFMKESIARGTNYFAYNDKEIDLIDPLSDPYEVNLHKIGDSVAVAGKKYAPGLRIKLKIPTLLNRLMPALTAATTAGDNRNQVFHDLFKGVCVRVADNRKMAHSMPYFTMDGSTNYTGAGILVYHHTNGGNDTLVQRYAFNSGNCAFFNRIGRSYGHHPVNSLFTSKAANDSIIGIQNMPGANIDIMIPGIKSLPKGVINKAEIRLSVLPWRKDTRFQPVDRLFPLRVNSGTYPAGLIAGTTAPVYDFFSGIAPFAVINGELNKINNGGTATETYTVNIPREVMTSLAAGNDTLHVRLIGSAIYSGAYRSILGGGDHPNSIYKAKLFVVYSALNK